MCARLTCASPLLSFCNGTVACRGTLCRGQRAWVSPTCGKPPASALHCPSARNGTVLRPLVPNTADGPRRCWRVLDARRRSASPLQSGCSVRIHCCCYCPCELLWLSTCTAVATIPAICYGCSVRVHCCCYYPCDSLRLQSRHSTLFATIPVICYPCCCCIITIPGSPSTASRYDCRRHFQIASTGDANSGHCNSSLAHCTLQAASTKSTTPSPRAHFGTAARGH